MNCIFCTSIIPQNRVSVNHPNPKYCSKKCIKRAWYIKSNPDTKSYLNNNPEFWNTATGRGFKWERYSANLLGAKHLEFNKFGADLDWNGKLVDVKSSELYKRKNKRGKKVIGKQVGWWSFNRGKIKPIDYFLCLCLKNGELVKKYLIPNSLVGTSGVVIGHISEKFDKYII